MPDKFTPKFEIQIVRTQVLNGMLEQVTGCDWYSRHPSNFEGL
jgi:hypothetical protein